jgi:hypothetical protein
VKAVEGENTNIHSFESFLAFSKDGIRDQMHSLGVRGESKSFLPRHGGRDAMVKQV